MADRRDALAGAAEIVLAIERSGRATSRAETVATVGTLDGLAGRDQRDPRPRPGSGSTCAASTPTSLDRLERGDPRRPPPRSRAARRRVQTVLTRAGEPVELDAALVAAALAAADALGIAARTTWSGAGHDAQHLTRSRRRCCVFVPLHGGESHTPQEGAI